MPAEFRLFAGAQRRRLYRVALLLTGDPGLAEDLVQTALMRSAPAIPAAPDPADVYDPRQG